MNVTEDGLRVLVALRSASALQREPRPLTPDGFCRWWALVELIGEGRLDRARGLDNLSSAARGLRKKHLVAGRTQFTVTRYAITDEGRVFLGALEDEAGVRGTVQAELMMDQARLDLERAERRLAVARATVRAAHADRDRPVLDELIAALKAGV